jgi:hypothetical protein
MSDPIKLTDIQAGDTIRVEWEYDDLQLTRTATVHTFRHGDWRTTGGQLVTVTGRDQCMYLIDRPKPKLPTEAGSLVFARIIEGTQDTLALRADGWWVSLGTGRFFKASEVAAHPWKLAKVVGA